MVGYQAIRSVLGMVVGSSIFRNDAGLLVCSQRGTLASG